MFAINEKQKILPDGTRLTTFTREVISANAIEVEVGTNGFKGGGVMPNTAAVPISALPISGIPTCSLRRLLAVTVIPVRSNSFLAATVNLKPSSER